MRPRLGLLAVALVAAACAAPILHPGFPDVEPPPPAGPSPERLTVFISDLHLGIGRDPATGGWHPFEDFRWEDEFRLFLKAIDSRGRGKTDLILNGDAFELWQALDGVDDRRDCLRGKKDLGLSKEEALRRFARVRAEHAAELRALRDFAASGDNTVTFVPGNHDAALLFPDVARAVLAATAAPAERVRILRRGYWLSTDGLVYAEHGHQIGEEVNRFEHWPNPFLAYRGEVRLRRPWGERFVQCYYNRFEKTYPTIDNVTDEATAVRYAMAAEGSLPAAVESVAFLRFFFGGVSWAQLGQSLGETGTAPAWDVAAVRWRGPWFLVESLGDGDALKPVVARAAAEGTLGLSVPDVTDDQIRAICDRRALLAAMQQRDPSLRHNVRRCPEIGGGLGAPREGGLGALGEKLFGSRDAVYGAHLKQVVETLRLRDRRFELFIYSHTHRMESPFRPLDEERLGWNPTVVNTGAWQRVISPAELERQGGDAAELLRRPPEALAPCYGVVLVPPYAGGLPKAEIRGWRRAAGGLWKLDEVCGT